MAFPTVRGAASLDVDRTAMVEVLVCLRRARVSMTENNREPPKVGMAQASQARCRNGGGARATEILLQLARRMEGTRARKVTAA